MAEYIGLGADEPLEASEKRVADALRRLPKEWIVLHHVSWQSKRGGRQGDGEADFIVLHPHKGMLVIEVKGGGIDIEAGRWYTTDRHGKRHSIKNPYEQAVASKHALVSWLRDRGFDSRIRVGHAVVFPNMSQLPWIGPAGTSKISFARPHLDAIESAIAECFEHWELTADMSRKDVEKVVGFLAPTVSSMPNLSGQSAEAETGILIFTTEQIEAFSGLRSHRGGLILGGAGTGKTTLAIARAQQLALDGFRTLLVCYNELLGNDLSARLPSSPNLTACTFHTLCLREARRAKLAIPNEKSREWWESSAPDLLIEACSHNSTIYDAIVVDEGQDFSPLWLDSLRCLISGEADAPFFTFADPLQDIWQRNWANGKDHPFVWELTCNMRNTKPIALRVAASVGMKCRDKGVSGPAPIWHLTDGQPREKDVIIVVERLLGEGFKPSNLVVLCSSAELVARLRERSIGAFSFGKWGSRGIPVETISRFKGLEAQAVVLVLSSPFVSTDIVEGYVGMSRGRSILVVVGDEAAQQSLNWRSS